MNGRTNSTSGDSSLSDLQVPLNPVSNLHVQLKTDLIEIMWTDPLDKYADELGNVTDEGDQLVSQFAYTKVVRKIGSLPSGPDDGEAIVSATTRNQYQSTPYIDSAIQPGNTYYYGLYVYNMAGVHSEGVFSEGFTPVQYDPILGNNSWDIIDDACNKGLEQSLWAVGDEIDISVMGETVTCLILGFKHDDLADGSGKASITFGLKNLMSFLNPQSITVGNYAFYRHNTGMRNWFDTTLYNGIEDSLRTKLKQVTKNSVHQRWNVDRTDYPGGTSISTKAYFDSEKSGAVYVFPFGAAEIKSAIVSSGEGRYESGMAREGNPYSYYTTQSSVIKSLPNGIGAATEWMLRTTSHLTGDSSGSQVCYINKYAPGYYNDSVPDGDPTANTYGICFGFCIGKATTE